jgi:glycosyltransferase involved in cell wall biosynthesis
MSITVDTVDDGLPISVIVPLSKTRKDFFENMVLPMLEANNPNEIIVNDNDGSAPKKRNQGFDKSTQPYVFFCDDDIVLPANYLKTLYDKLLHEHKSPHIGYSYTGYYGVVLHPETHPFRGNFRTPSTPFNADALRKGNYVSTMSLMKREVFPRFDENLQRFQDWDMYLTMLKKGVYGVMVDKIFFWAYYLDTGITSNNNSLGDALQKIRNKHG